MTKAFIKLFAIFLFLGFGAYLLQAITPSHEGYTNFIENHLLIYGNYSIILFMLLSALLICFAVPRQLISFVAGYTFGIAQGTIFATLGVSFGCVLSFYFARLVGQSFVQKKFGNKIDKMENFLSRNIFSMTLIIRFLPLGNNLATNMLTGLTKINPSNFFLASCIGYVPQNFIFAMLGSGIKIHAKTQIILSAILLLIATILGYYLYQKNKKALFILDEA